MARLRRNSGSRARAALASRRTRARKRDEGRPIVVSYGGDDWRSGGRHVAREDFPADAIVIQINYTQLSPGEMEARQRQERMGWRQMLEKERRRRDYAGNGLS